MPYADPTGFLSAVLHNGVGRFVCQLQRITLQFCKESRDSLGMREFIELDLLDFARKNPGIVVYVQPKRHNRTKLHAEYLNGRVEDVDALNWSREYIIKYLDLMRCKSGAETVKLYKDQRTEYISIQGPWNPFTNQPTNWNITKFPEPEGLKAIKYKKTATEIIMEKARAQGILNIVEHVDKEIASGKESIEREDDQIIQPVTATFSESKT